MSDLYRELDTPTFRLAVAQFEEAAERLRLDHNLRERLKIPQRALIVSDPVRMDDGSVKVFVGYRVQHDTALGPSKGGVRFHPEVNLGEVADSAFGGPEGRVVLHAIADKHLDAAIIHADRDRHDQRPLGNLEPLAQVVIQAEALGGLFKLRHGQPKRRGVQFPIEVRHDPVAQACWGVGSSGGASAAASCAARSFSSATWSWAYSRRPRTVDLIWKLPVWKNQPALTSTR